MIDLADVGDRVSGSSGKREKIGGKCGLSACNR